MSKPKKVNRYRSGSHNPEIEVHIYRGRDIVVHVVDWQEGKVETLRGEKPPAKETPRPS